LGRTSAVVTALSAVFVLSIPIVLSQGPWSQVRVFGRDLFGIVDYVTGTYMLATGGLLIALYVAAVWGWARFRDETNLGSERVKVTAAWMPFVRFIVPLAVGLVLLSGLASL
jgi:NSS family neurotransmitter:Na+ symporter